MKKSTAASAATTAAALPGRVADIAELGADLARNLQTLAGTSLPLPTVAKLQSDYLQQAAAMWNQAVAAPAPTAPSDRRFAGQDWVANPMAAYLAQVYLLNARTMMQMADSVEGEPKTRQRIRFAVQQWIDMASPRGWS